MTKIIVFSSSAFLVKAALDRVGYKSATFCTIQKIGKVVVEFHEEAQIESFKQAYAEISNNKHFGQVQDLMFIND